MYSQMWGDNHELVTILHLILHTPPTPHSCGFGILYLCLYNSHACAYLHLYRAYLPKQRDQSVVKDTVKPQPSLLVPNLSFKVIQPENHPPIKHTFTIQTIYIMPGVVPSLKRIDVSEQEKIIQCVKENGCVIIKNFSLPETVDQVNEETRPYLEKDKPWKGDLFPPETRRCSRLIARSKIARENWLVHPLVSALTAEFVDKTTSNFYGQQQHTYTSKAIASITITMEIGPGGKAQRLHRDDKNFHVHHADQTETGYQKEADVMMAFLIPGVDTTFENGATQVCVFFTHSLVCPRSTLQR